MTETIIEKTTLEHVERAEVPRCEKFVTDRSVFLDIKRTVLKGLIPWLFILPGIIGADEKTYVTCSWMGELGNQMFQVAATVAYALDHDCEPVFTSFDYAAGGELNYQYVFHRLKILQPDQNFHYEEHPGHIERYIPIPYEKGKNMRLRGLYQNERYFAHHKEYIQQLFAPTQEIFTYITKKYGDLKKLFKDPVVGVHVRTFIPSARNPEVEGFEGASWEYFIKAIEYFPENYTFFVFTDHPAWTRKHFPRIQRKIRFIEGNPRHIDLYFMSLCHHQVVSPGSTFSWWASWLNRNPNKIVIAPHYWQQRYTEEDAFPSDWTRIYAPQIKNGLYGN